MAPNDRSPVLTTPNPAQDSACPRNVTAGRVMSRCGLACLGPCRKQRCRQVDPGGPLQRWAHHTPGGPGRCDAMLQLGRMPSRTPLRRRLAPTRHRRGSDAAPGKCRPGRGGRGVDRIARTSREERNRVRGYLRTRRPARTRVPARGYLRAGTRTHMHTRGQARAGAPTRGPGRASARRGAHTRARAREREGKPGGVCPPTRAHPTYVTSHLRAPFWERGIVVPLDCPCVPSRASLGLRLG